MFRKKPQPQSQVEWLIVGLGNPGGEYKSTRHNVGFTVVERLAAKHHIKLNRGRHRSLMGEGSAGGTSIAVAKPLTYMNLSGQSVAPLAKSLGVKPHNILVVADDLDLPVGKVKMKLKGSSGGHNGHKSLIASLHTDDYPRIKIGIGKVDKSDTIGHVLGNFDRDEMATMDEILALSVELCETIVTAGWEPALRLLERYYAGR